MRDDTNHVKVRCATGISVRFDQSNDIVSNQPETTVFHCLPSPPSSHFPKKTSYFRVERSLFQSTSSDLDLRSWEGNGLLCILKPAEQSKTGSHPTFSLFLIIRGTRRRRGEARTAFPVHRQSGGPLRFWPRRVANTIEVNV